MFISIGNFSSNILLKEENKLQLDHNYFSSFYTTMKDYEDNFDLASCIECIEDRKDPNQNYYLIIDPDDNQSGVSLKLIEKLKEMNKNVYVFMILKEVKNLNKQKLFNQNLNFTVYQDLARAGEINRLFLIDLSLVISKFNVSLRNFEKSVSESVSKIIKNCCFVLENPPIYGTEFTTPDIKRISTFGILQDKVEFYFYNFQTDVVSQKHYLFYLNDEELNDGNNTLTNINSLLSNKDESCSYSIYESGATTSITYVIKSTNYVEQIKE